MIQAKNFKNCQVFIYDFYTSKKIAKTQILEYSRSNITMQVSLRDFETQAPDKVTMIIVQDSLVYEFNGVIHKSSRDDIVEIALFKGKSIEHRQTKRFEINIQGDASKLIIGNKLVPLNNVQPVDIINISTNGLLIKASPLRFNINTRFQINLHLAENDSSFNVKVVRLNRINEYETEYGCVFY